MFQKENSNYVLRCEKLSPHRMKQFRVLDPALSVPQVSRGFCALAVMTKAPHAGRVKTRLVPPLTPEEAAELNKCFLRDTVAAISNVCSHRPACRPKLRRRRVGDVGETQSACKPHASHSAMVTARACGIAVYTPVGAESAYADILPADFTLLPQRGDKFGERLYFAVEDLFKCGFESVCLIDSDSPTVPGANFDHAIQVLAAPGNRLVLGPSDDGGYYLIGLKKPDRRLFEQIDWSTERVVNQTIERANDIELEVKLLPTGYDVDDEAGLRRLCDELLGNECGSSNEVAPSTRRFLASLVARKKL
jgi:uncharacterized protein